MVNRVKDAARVDPPKKLSEFAETLVVPDGQYKNSKFRLDTLPHVRLLYEAIESGRWNTFAITGCVQSGKTLTGTTIPLMYYANELKETVVYGVPTEEMWKDKWKGDIEPVFRASRYISNLPSRGIGSKGGVADAVLLKNGATIKSMSGRGGDEKRSGFTARIVVITECDKMDDIRNASDETNPIKQIIARTKSFKWHQKRVFLECTVSHSQGFIWQEYLHGTESKLFHKCPDCGNYVHLERENLKGWDSATTELEAFKNSYFECPECGYHIDDKTRKYMCKYENTRLVHKGQSADKEGVIHGEYPETLTLGFRWNAFENLLRDIGEYGAEEFKANIAEDMVSAEREIKQFNWASPCDPDNIDIRKLSATELRSRTDALLTKGLCPSDTLFITCGIDIGLHHCWAVYIAWTRPDASKPRQLRGHIINYENWKLDIEKYTQDEAGIRAVQTALGHYIGFHDQNQYITTNGRKIPVKLACIDSGYGRDENGRNGIYEFCRTRGFEDCVPIKGYGQSINMPQYHKPSKAGGEVLAIGNNNHLKYLQSSQTYIIETNADYWKSQVHERLGVATDNPQAITLYASPNKAEHNQFINHIVGENLVMETTSIGNRFVWRKAAGRRANHYLDATAYCTMAGSYCNDSLIERERKTNEGQNGPNITHKNLSRKD